MLFKTEAVVLRKNKISEADVILTLFTRKYGKLRAVAKSGRKPKSRLSSTSHIFTYGEFIINKGKNLDKISSVDLFDSFYNIREDLTRLAYGSYLLELCDSVIVEGITNNRLFNSLLQALHVLTKSDSGYNIVKIAFQVHLLNYIGFMPEIKSCVNCGGTKFSKLRFNIMQGGLICDVCKEEYSGGIIVDSTTLKVINYMATNEIIKSSKIKLSESIIFRLGKIMDSYVETHLEKRYFKSLDFLRTIEKNLS